MNEQCKFCSAWVPSGGIWDHLLCEHSSLKSTGPIIVSTSAQDGEGTSAGRTYSEDTNTLAEVNGAEKELNFDEFRDDSHVDDNDIENEDDDADNNRNVSVIWSFFKKYFVDGLYLGAICNLCGKNLKQPGNKSTSNLHKHMSKAHHKEYESMKSGWADKKNSYVCSNKLGSKFIWMNFSKIEGHRAQCNLCREILRQSHDSGTPENLLKHLYSKHQAVVEKAVVWKSQNGGQKIVVVETKEEDAIESKEGIVAAPETGVPATCGTAKKERRRSFAWRHFLRMNKTDAMCQLCLKTFRTSEGSTSNLLKHLNTVHFDEIRSDAEQFNKENLDASFRVGVLIPDLDPGDKSMKSMPLLQGMTATTSRKMMPNKMATSEDFCSLFGKQFIQEQFSCGVSRAACLWCSAKISHNFGSSDLGLLAEHLLANHRNVCEKALAKRFEKKGPLEKVVISPKSVRDENGYEEVRGRSERSSFLFNFEDSDDEELYDILGSSNFDVGRTTEQLIGLRKAWLKFCSEREKVHDLDIMRLKTRLKEKQNILRDVEREVASITEELAEKIKQRRQELFRQKVLDARILSKKAMRVREKFYNVKSTIAREDAGSDCSDENNYRDRKGDKIINYKASTKKHQKDSDADDDTYGKNRKVINRSVRKHYKDSDDDDDDDDDYRESTKKINRRATVKKCRKGSDDDDNDDYRGSKRTARKRNKDSDDGDYEDGNRNNCRATRKKLHEESHDDDDDLDEQNKCNMVRKHCKESDDDDDGYEKESKSNYRTAKRRRKESDVDDSDEDWEPEHNAKNSKSSRRDQSTGRSSCVTRRVSFEKRAPNTRNYSFQSEQEAKTSQSGVPESTVKRSILRSENSFSRTGHSANKVQNRQPEPDFDLLNFEVHNLSSVEQVEVQNSLLGDGDAHGSSIDSTPADVGFRAERNCSDVKTYVVDIVALEGDVSKSDAIKN